MEFWIIPICLVAFFLILPYIRWFFKRVKCAVKIKRMCVKKGYRMHAAHSFWFFGSNLSRKCDLYIESENQVLAIKLFGVRKKVSMLYIKENNEYFIRSFFGLMYYGGILSFPFDSRARAIPNYDFRYGYKDEWEIKTPKAILLVNPVPVEIRKDNHGSEEIVSSGEIINGMTLYSLSRLLGLLENAL